MIQNPTLRVLSSFQKQQVKALLMGGQACIFYGAAEFSRDADFVILASMENVGRLSAALDELRAERVAVPPFELQYLMRGHAVHFRCQHEDVKGLRIDVMSILRGVLPFDELWSRRTTVETPDGATYDLLSLPDLALAKKTQRDKDWPMLRRLLEAHYFTNRDGPSMEHVRFWLMELRTAKLLVEVARAHEQVRAALTPNRPLLALAENRRVEELEDALLDEEKRERAEDRTYWRPLKEELEKLRHEEARRRRE